MALLNLSTQQKKDISRRWVIDDRSLLGGFEQTRGLLPSVDDVHNGLLDYAPHATSELDRTLQLLRDEEQLTDRVHDFTLRGIYYALTARYYFAATPQEAQRYLFLRDNVLFPLGLGTTQLSLREESGAAAMLEGRLTDALRVELAAIVASADGETLLHKLNAHLAAGARLGQLEDQKDALLKQLPTFDPNAPTDAEVRASHLAWIKIARLLRETLPLARPDAATTEAILGPLRAAEKLADERAAAEKARKKAEEEAAKKAEEEAAKKKAEEEAKK